jgi:hypothetical protein
MGMTDEAKVHVWLIEYPLFTEQRKKKKKEISFSFTPLSDERKSAPLLLFILSGKFSFAPFHRKNLADSPQAPKKNKKENQEEDICRVQSVERHSANLKKLYYNVPPNKISTTVERFDATLR